MFFDQLNNIKYKTNQKSEIYLSKFLLLLKDLVIKIVNPIIFAQHFLIIRKNLNSFTKKKV